MGGLVLFGIFLEFFSWRLMFLSFLPLGIIAVIAAIPLLRQKEHSRPTTTAPVDIIGGILMVAVAFVLIMSSNHLHGGEESFTSSKGLSYHIPMQILFLVLVVVFILVERYIKHPLVEMRHFREKYFSLALTSNFAFHFSMLATTTLIPILVENGYGMSPLWVPVILLPNQLLGFSMPLLAGWVYDKYRPKYLRPAAMATIALGFLMLGLSVGHVPFFALPFLMLPISIGSSVFNPINNATVMSALPLEHRGVASGMLETTRELGHAIGATVSATALAIVLPVGISALSGSEAQRFYIDGFRFSSLMVVITLLIGAFITYFHKEIAETAKTITSGSSSSSQAQPTLQSESTDGDD
ncbi:MAG: MFS transporter, partial [Pseudomonadales bacterium]